MAYIGTVEYDEGGRIQSLDGLADVVYDSGRTRNLLGAEMVALKYDDGGRFRTLVGLGQDDIPMDLPLAPPSSDIPLMYEPPTPSPIIDTVSADITGGLTPPSAPPVRPIFYTPLPTVDTVSAPLTGTLVHTTQQAVPPAVQIPSVLTSLFSGIKNIFGSAGSAVRPSTAGTMVSTTAPASGWFSGMNVVSGLPNWGLLAGVGVAGMLLLASLKGGGGGSSRRRNPGRRRRRNPAELLLMGANPARRRRVR
jgi:hypothetical protein